MNSYKKITLLFCILLLIESCEKELSIPERFEKQMVLTGTLSPDDSIKIRLLSNFSAKDKSTILPIVGATVEIYEDSILLGALSYDSAGIYSLAYIPKEGRLYKLTASCSGYPNIEASTSIPNNCKYKIYQDLFPDEYGGDSIRLTNLSLESENQLSFYGLTYYSAFLKDVSEFQDGSKMVSLYQIEPMLNRLDNIVEFFDQNTYTGYTLKCFYDLSFNFDLKTYFSNDAEKSNGNKSTVFFSNFSFQGKPYVFKNRGANKCNLIKFYQFSPELYYALRGIAAYESTNGSAISDYFITPIAVKSNVKGGLGYFGGCLPHTIKF